MIKSDLMKIHKNRLLQSQKEISEFEKSLANLMNSGDASIVGELCLGFDDDTEHHEVMFGLVHGVEYLYENNIEEGLQQIALNVPNVINRAREWMEILHYRILNHDGIRLIYGKELSKLNNDKKNAVISLLEDIKKENPEKFGRTVDEVLKVI